MNTLKSIGIAVAAAALGFSAARWLDPAGEDAGKSADSGEPEILYWVAPMDPNFRRDEPGKSPMGMDLVPVYADGSSGGGQAPGITIDSAVLNNIGVKSAAVERTTLSRRIETVGFVAPDAERIGHIHVRSEGWIENLVANSVGERIEAGDVAFEIYSPALVSAQDEYLQALRVGREELIAAGRQRLRALGMVDEQIDTVRESRRTRQRFEVRSPQDGYIMELNVRDGMYVEPGVTIISLADLSEVWVDVDVFEQQIDWVEVGQPAEMRLPFAPERVWRGEVDYIYPTIRPETRTARIRLAFDNPDLALKPNMYATVNITVSPHRDVLAVPSQAVIRTGSQERVVLNQGNGRFRPAEVVTGLETEGRVEIVDGLSEGERIVISSQFLIDSEASMDASLLRMLDDDPGGMDHSGHDMSGMDHSGHEMEGMDHSEHQHHGATQDAPTPTLPREQGREKKATDHADHGVENMNHAGHDMEGMDHSEHQRHGARQDAPTPALPREQGREKEATDHAGHDMENMDHSGHDMEGMDHSEHQHHGATQGAPAPALPREQGREKNAMDGADHDMQGMDHAGHDKGSMDHSGHDMTGMDDSLPPPPAGEGRGGGASAGQAQAMDHSHHHHGGTAPDEDAGGTP